VVYGVIGSKLCTIGVDGTYVELADIDPSYPMSFAGIGNAVYYSNPKCNGYVLGGVRSAWEKGDKNYSFITTRGYVEPPMGSLLLYYKGRMFVAVGSALHISDSYGLNVFDSLRGYIPFDSNVIMLKGVDKGLWVGTELGIYFLRDLEDGFFRFSKESNFVTEYGTAQMVDGSYAFDSGLSNGEEDRTKEVVLFVAESALTGVSKLSLLIALAKEPLPSRAGSLG